MQFDLELEFLSAVRLLRLALADFSEFFTSEMPAAAGHENPYAEVSDVNSDDLFDVLELEARSVPTFVDFATGGSQGWARTVRQIRVNVSEVFQPIGEGETASDFWATPASQGDSEDATPLMVSRLRGDSQFGATPLGQPGCANYLLVFRALKGMCRLAGLLAHELGHQTYWRVFGVTSGATNVFEGKVRFTTFDGSISDLSFRPEFWISESGSPFPPIASVPAEGEVTRHWTLSWLQAAVAGWSWGWDVGMACELIDLHQKVCLLRECGSGGTGYSATCSEDLDCSFFAED